MIFYVFQSHQQKDSVREPCPGGQEAPGAAEADTEPGTLGSTTSHYIQRYAWDVCRSIIKRQNGTNRTEQEMHKLNEQGDGLSPHFTEKDHKIVIGDPPFRCFFIDPCASIIILLIHLGEWILS